MTKLINREDGVLIAQTKMTCNGRLIWVSTTTDGGDTVGYWETSVFGADPQGELDIDQQITEERHYFNEVTYREAENACSRDADRLLNIHNAMVAALVHLDAGVIFSHTNDIADVLWAVNANDYTHLKV